MKLISIIVLVVVAQACRNGDGSPSWCRAHLGRCGGWASAGECTKNPNFMLTCCQASCGVCGARTSTSQKGNCKVAGVDVFNNKVHATYVDCAGLDKTLTLKVDVQDMLGIHHCPLIQDWVMVIGCPGAICTLQKTFTMSFDVCDAIAFIATAGMASLAKEVGKQAAFQAIGNGIKQVTSATVRKFAGYAAKHVVKKQVKGLCQQIGKFIQDFIKCLGGGRSSAMRHIASGIGELLKVIEKLFGSVQFKLDVGTKFNLHTVSFGSWQAGVEVTWNMGALSIGPRMILTGVARLVSSVREGRTCDNFDTVAAAASVKIRFIPRVEASFKIKCEPITFFGISLKQLSDGLKQAGRAMAHWMSNMGNAVGNTVNALGEAIVRAFTGRPSSSRINAMKQTYHVRHEGCKRGCPGGWQHFYTSDHGCCKSFGSCGGNRKWCRIKKKYTDWSGRRELAVPQPPAELDDEYEETVADDLSWLESLASLSEEQAEDMLATFPEEDIAEVEALEQAQHEEALADEGEWIQTHPELTEEEQAEYMEELVQAVEPIFEEEGFEAEMELAEDADTEQIEEFLAELLANQN